jgi:hypothetical protein
MFIVWGKKRVVRKLGYVADFCPMCRTARSFTVQRIGVAGHVYYLSFGEGKLVAFHRNCDVCDIALNANPDRYVVVSPDKADLATLKTRTFPQLDEVHRERIELERTIENNPSALAPDIRRALIREPLYLLAPSAEARFAKTHLDREAGIALVISLLALGMAFPLSTRFLPDSLALPAILAIAVTGLLATGFYTFRSRYRYLERTVYPKLARSLAPLNPTAQELEAALGDLALRSKPVAKRIRVPDLLRHI